MKTLRMLRDFDYAPMRKWSIVLKAGYVIGRVPEAAVKAILAAGAGELVEVSSDVDWPKRGKR